MISSLSLRARLFLTIAAVLAVSVGASGLLSRRATLVEVREIVRRSTARPDLSLDAVARGIEADLVEGQRDRVSARLRTFEQETRHPLILIDARLSIVAASSDRLAAAHVESASRDGDLRLTGEANGRGTMVEVRRAPVHVMTSPSGGDLMLFALPEVAEREPASPPVLSRAWVASTVVTAIVALGLAFGLSRRILRPVSALTSAAQRMGGGDLGVRVEVEGRDEIAELARSFNTMASRLEENERLRRQLVGDVAHELRSPVTNLRCTLEGMQDGLVAADRHAIDALHEETLFLQRLITDLQDLALAESGRLELHRRPVQVGEILQRAIAPFAGAPGPQIVVKVPALLPACVADPDRLEQVFRNLLTNARRHTPLDGSIVAAANADRGRLDVSIEDSGCGIEAEHLPHVFDRFYRADASRSRATGGAGLGLAIARQIALAHGGDITVASAGFGKGTTFTVTLPLAEAAVS